MDTHPQPPFPVPDDEIDLADLLRQLWAGKWIILITTVVFVVGGILYSVYQSMKTVKEYQSQVTLFVETPTSDSLLKVFSYPPFFSDLLQTELAGSQPDGPLSVQQVLERQTPPAGTIATLMSRVTATKGDAGTLAISVKMQQPDVSTRLADSIVQKLFQFLRESQWNRMAMAQQTLVEDSIRDLRTKTDELSRQLLYQEKESRKNIQTLTEVFTRAESLYLQSRQTLAEYYTTHAGNPGSIDSLEVKRLNEDIKMRYTVYSEFYQQLEHAKIFAKEKAEQAKLDAQKQLEETKINAARQIEQIRLAAGRQQPAITILEPATGATLVNVSNPMKIPLIMLFLGVITGVGIVFGRKFYMKNFAGNNA